MRRSTKGDDTPVVLGPRLDTYAFRRESLLAFDSYHLCSNVRFGYGSVRSRMAQCSLDTTVLLPLQGYKVLARNTADFLVPIMTGVEWKTWKKQLEKVTYDKELYD
ncbi:hypothetical protein PINS_up000158 [Pythium insidiosum]|nr:hypothetical protein PINS_up000158 [Pythium insidiosum]